MMPLAATSGTDPSGICFYMMGSALPIVMKSFLLHGIALWALAGATFISGHAQDFQKPQLDLNAAHRGTPDVDNAFLALSQPSAEIAGYFKTVRLVLEANRQSRIADQPKIAAAANAAGLVLTGGPMLGLTPEGEHTVWVRTAKPAKVEVKAQTADGTKTFGPVASTAEADLTAVIPLKGITPSRPLIYQIVVDGSEILIPEITPTAPAKEPAASETRILFGADFHKSGLWNTALLRQMASRKASAALLLGDLAADDRNNLVGLHRSDYLLRDLSPGWRALAAGTPILTTWDDHDYFDNDLSGIPEGFTAADRAAVRAVWHENWVNPGRDLDNTDHGIESRTRVGPCDVILLDTRSHRGPKGGEGAFLGREQIEWLEKQLADCKAPFLILSSGTMWSDEVSKGKDSWGVWDPAGRKRIFSMIAEKKLAVLLLSGDRHGARVMRIPWKAGHAFREFEVGSLGGHPGPSAKTEDDKFQLFGMEKTPLFGEFAFDTTGPEPAVTARILDAEGNEVYSERLRRSELIP